MWQRYHKIGLFHFLRLLPNYKHLQPSALLSQYYLLLHAPYQTDFKPKNEWNISQNRFQGFNTGVVLYNLKAMRESSVYNRCLMVIAMTRILKSFILKIGFSISYMFLPIVIWTLGQLLDSWRNLCTASLLQSRSNFIYRDSRNPQNAIQFPKLQDWFTNLGFLYPQLFHILSCR